MISLAGGLVGVRFGVGATRTIADVFEWPTRVSGPALTLAMASAAAIGMFFGYYPARRASRLDPIDALRWE
jgi:ABC-type antimicrobial peptide transport system permease subunit